MEWEVVLYPRREFGPEGDFPGTFDPAWSIVFNQQAWQDHGLPTYDERLLHGDIANMPFFFFEAEPVHFFEVVWFPGTGQQEPLMLMPIVDPRDLWGDIANMPYFSFQSFEPAHFGPNGDGDIEGPASVDILEGPASFEVRGA